MGKPVKRVYPCTACNGRGWTNVRKPSGLTVSDICKSCGGNGVVYR